MKTLENYLGEFYASLKNKNTKLKASTIFKDVNTVNRFWTKCVVSPTSYTKDLVSGYFYSDRDARLEFLDNVIECILDPNILGHSTSEINQVKEIIEDPDLSSQFFDKVATMIKEQPEYHLDYMFGDALFRNVLMNDDRYVKYYSGLDKEVLAESYNDIMDGGIDGISMVIITMHILDYLDNMQGKQIAKEEALNDIVTMCYAQVDQWNQNISKRKVSDYVKLTFIDSDVYENNLNVAPPKPKLDLEDVLSFL